MRIKSLAQGENILMLGIEPSTFVSKIDILTTTPIVQWINGSINELLNREQFNNAYQSLSVLREKAVFVDVVGEESAEALPVTTMGYYGSLVDIVLYWYCDLIVMILGELAYAYLLMLGGEYFVS